MEPSRDHRERAEVLANADRLKQFADQLAVRRRELSGAAAKLEAALVVGHRLARFDAILDAVRSAFEWTFYEPGVGLRSADVWVVVGSGGIPADMSVVTEQPGERRPDLQELRQHGGVIWGEDLLRDAADMRELIARGAEPTTEGRQWHRRLLLLRLASPPPPKK